MKTIYLTFDDGPSETTEGLLEILKKHDVRASFFVTGRYGYTDLIGRMKKEGHLVCLHSFSHAYADVYASAESYFSDLRKIEALVCQQCGTVEKIVRLPGASNNTVSYRYGGKELCGNIIRRLLADGYLVLDWDCENGDGLKPGLTADTYYRNAVASLSGRDDAVFLSHTRPGDENSIASLDQFIPYLKEQGYVFCQVNAIKCSRFFLKNDP